MRALIRKELHIFHKSPMRNVNMPMCLKRMTTTQGLFVRAEFDAKDIIDFSLRLSAFIRRRNAGIIQRHWLQRYYRPDGPWFQKTFVAPGNPLWLTQR